MPLAESEVNQFLERTRSKLTHWRRRNKAPKAIPDDIWKSAVELSHHLGLGGTVSRELKLDYGSLKRRAAEPLGLIQSCVVQLQSARCQATLQLQSVRPQELGAILREVLL